MKLINGDGNPQAHLERRHVPECDIYGAPLKGRMPDPYFFARTASKDGTGRAIPEAAVRVYLCRQHREAVRAAMDPAWRREQHRLIAGQRIFGGSPVKGVKS